MQDNFQEYEVTNQIPPESMDYVPQAETPALAAQMNSFDAPPAKLESLTSPDEQFSSEIMHLQNEANLNPEFHIQPQQQEQHRSYLFLYSLFGIIIILLISLVAVLYSQYSTNNASARIYTNTVSETSTPSVAGTSITATTTPVENLYQNEYFKVSIPQGWDYKVPMTGALNITKDNYILYINANFQQTSQIRGGKFYEISSGAPSADAVIKSQPATPCGITESSSIKDQKRFDYYVSSAETSTTCNKPTAESPVWYLSYLSDGNGFFNYYKSDSTKAIAITMSYNSRDINKLPRKGDTKLEEIFTEISDIVETIEFVQN